MASGKAYGIAAGLILLIAAMIMFHAFPSYDSEATKLSAVVLIGLALTVVFMAILAITFSILGIGNSEQALGLPEGSIRALLAFSLVLIFVMISTSLFSAASKPFDMSAGKTLPRVTDSQLIDLKTNFIVAAGQARGPDDKPIFEQMQDPADKTKTVDDLKHPIYTATYYPKPNAEAADFGKQIFTTLATIFVSVVSFYFGSSVTASAAAAGAKNVIGVDGDKQAANLQSALTSALADSHAAQITLDQAAARLQDAQKTYDRSRSPSDEAAIVAAENALSDAKKNLQEKQARVQSAQDAMNAAQARTKPVSSGVQPLSPLNSAPASS